MTSGIEADKAGAARRPATTARRWPRSALRGVCGGGPRGRRRGTLAAALAEPGAASHADGARRGRRATRGFRAGRPRRGGWRTSSPKTRACRSRSTPSAAPIAAALGELAAASQRDAERAAGQSDSARRSRWPRWRASRARSPRPASAPDSAAACGRWSTPPTPPRSPSAGAARYLAATPAVRGRARGSSRGRRRRRSSSRSANRDRALQVLLAGIVVIVEAARPGDHQVAGFAALPAERKPT